jgi:succinate dehydrogenase / fumarate reductase membrane anchor subunit
MTLRTPLAKVRGLGSARDGTSHFWLQRVTAVANIFLVCFVLGLMVRLVGRDYAYVKGMLANPLVSLPLLLLVLSATLHMRIGMQVIIEDYIHKDGLKVLLLLLNTFFTVIIALASVYAVLKLSFGA